MPIKKEVNRNLMFKNVQLFCYELTYLIFFKTLDPEIPLNSDPKHSLHRLLIAVRRIQNPNTLKLDPDPECWSNLDPDQQHCLNG